MTDDGPIRTRRARRTEPIRPHAEDRWAPEFPDNQARRDYLAASLEYGVNPLVGYAAKEDS